MNLELMKLKRDRARVYSAKLDQEITLAEMEVKILLIKDSIKSSENALEKFDKQIEEAEKK